MTIDATKVTSDGYPARPEENAASLNDIRPGGDVPTRTARQRTIPQEGVLVAGGMVPSRPKPPAPAPSTMVNTWNKLLLPTPLPGSNPTNMIWPVPTGPAVINAPTLGQGQPGLSKLWTVFGPGSKMIQVPEGPRLTTVPTDPTLAVANRALTTDRINQFAALDQNQKMLVRSMFVAAVDGLNKGQLTPAGFNEVVGLILTAAQQTKFASPEPKPNTGGTIPGQVEVDPAPTLAQRPGAIRPNEIVPGLAPRPESSADSPPNMGLPIPTAVKDPNKPIEEPVADGLHQLIQSMRAQDNQQTLTLDAILVQLLNADSLSGGAYKENIKTVADLLWSRKDFKQLVISQPNKTTGNNFDSDNVYIDQLFSQVATVSLADAIWTVLIKQTRNLEISLKKDPAVNRIIADLASGLIDLDNISRFGNQLSYLSNKKTPPDPQLREELKSIDESLYNQVINGDATSFENLLLAAQNKTTDTTTINSDLINFLEKTTNHFVSIFPDVDQKTLNRIIVGFFSKNIAIHGDSPPWLQQIFEQTLLNVSNATYGPATEVSAEEVSHFLWETYQHIEDVNSMLRDAEVNYKPIQETGPETPYARTHAAHDLGQTISLSRFRSFILEFESGKFKDRDGNVVSTPPWLYQLLKEAEKNGWNKIPIGKEFYQIAAGLSKKGPPDPGALGLHTAADHHLSDPTPFISRPCKTPTTRMNAGDMG
jgi:hypothetical protein